MATSPSATPQPKGRSGPGCLLALLLLPVVIVLGLVIGTLLNRGGDDPNGTAAITILDGTLGATDWKVEATRDVQGSVCAFLYEDGDDAPTNGACSLTPQDVTYGDQTVVFGRAASDTSTAEVQLSDGRTIDIPTQAVDGIEGRFYAQVVDGDVDAVG